MEMCIVHKCCVCRRDVRVRRPLYCLLKKEEPRKKKEGKPPITARSVGKRCIRGMHRLEGGIVVSNNSDAHAQYSAFAHTRRASKKVSR